MVIRCSKSYVTTIFLSMYLNSSLYYSDSFRMWVTDFPQSKTIVKQGGALQGCVDAFISASSCPPSESTPPCHYVNFSIYLEDHYLSFFSPMSLGSTNLLPVSSPHPRPISLLVGSSPAVARERQTQAFEVAKSEHSQRRFFPKAAFRPIIKDLPKGITCCHFHRCLQGNLFFI